MQWVVAGGILDQTGQQRALGAAQLRGRFGKKDLGSRLQPKGKIAVVGLVEVKRQQLILGVALFEPPGQPGLAQFTAQTLFIALLRFHQEVAR